MFLIRLKLAISLVLVFTVFVIGLYIFSRQSLRDFFIADKKQESLYLLEILALNSQKEVYKILENQGYWITIADLNGKVLYDTYRFYQDNLKYKEEIKTGFAFRSENGKNYFFVAKTTSQNYIRLGLEDISAILPVFHESFYIYIIIGVVLLIGIFVFSLEKILEPIKKIVRFTKRFGSGLFHERIHYFGGGELALVTRNLNEMAETIENNYKEIKKRQELIETVILNLPVGVALLDERGKMEIYNPKIEILLNNAMKTKKPYYENFMHSKILETIKECYEKQIDVQNKIPVVSMEQNSILNFSAHFINNKVLTVVSDITEAEKLNRLKQQFISDIIHEFKTPIAIIMGYIEILEDSLKNEEKNYIQKTKNALNRLSEMINDLVRLEKIEYASIFGEMQEIHLNQLIEKVIEALLPLAQKKGIQIHFKNPNKEIIIKGIEDILYYCFYNIIDNSIKYLGKPTGNIEIEVRENGNKVTISFCDDGIGIPKPYREDVFRRFFRISKSRNSQNGAGSGLGLSIVREGVKFHKGIVYCKDTPTEKGICFEIVLPKKI